MQALVVQQHTAGEDTPDWRDKLAVQDTLAALGMAHRTESSPPRWVNLSWWRLRGELQRRYDFSQHAVR